MREEAERATRGGDFPKSEVIGRLALLSLYALRQTRVDLHRPPRPSTRSPTYGHPRPTAASSSSVRTSSTLSRFTLWG